MESMYRLYSIADLAPGDHLCCLYQTEDEHRELLGPYVHSGLERGEKVLYIVDAHTAQSVLGYLEEGSSGAKVDVRAALDRGQLVILSGDETYVRDGVFNPVAMIDLLCAETEVAVAEGYPALRVTGEMSWAMRDLPGSGRLIEYEARLNEFIPGSRCLALCQYDRRRFPAEVLLDVVRTHPVVVVGTRFYDNFYYLPPGDLVGEHDATTTLDHWIAQLAARRDTEEALVEEAAVNAAMAELSATMIAEASLDTISDLVLAQAKELTGSAFGYVGYIDPQSGALVSTTLTREIWDSCQVDGKQAVFETFGGLWGWVLNQRQPLLTNSPADDPRATGVPAGHVPIERFLSAPAMLGDKLLGQVALANAPRDYGARDLAMVERLAALYALAVQRHRAQEDRARLASIVESSDDAIIGQALDGTILSWNRGAEVMYGYSAAEAIGRPIGIVAPDDRRDEGDEILARVARGEAVAHLRTVHMGKRGRRIDVSVTVSPIRDGCGNIVGASSIARDVTEMVQAEEVRVRELRSLEQMSGPPPAAVTAEVLGLQPILEAQPDLFRGLVGDYGRALEQALERRVYRVDEDLSEPLRALASRLGVARAGPRDVIQLHVTSLQEKSQGASSERAKGYTEEGRLLVLELMGYLVAHYRHRLAGGRVKYGSGHSADVARARGAGDKDG